MALLSILLLSPSTDFFMCYIFVCIRIFRVRSRVKAASWAESVYGALQLLIKPRMGCAGASVLGIFLSLMRAGALYGQLTSLPIYSFAIFVYSNYLP